MAIARVFDTDTAEQSAIKIFDDFEINQSCMIVGFEIVDGKPELKGQIVLNRIKDLYMMKNCVKNKSGKYVQKRVRLSNTIGGRRSEKIWRFKWHPELEYKVTIWRIQ